MKTKFLGIALVVIIAIAIGGYQFPVVKKEVNERVGAVVGPELLSPFFSVNGVTHEYRRAKLNTATTTPCALKSPSSTSTLLYAALRLNTGTSTDTTLWTVAKAATGFATTTAFDSFSVSATDRATMYVGSASSTVPDEISVIAPNQFIVWGVAGTVPAGTTNLTGVCQAEFIVI